MTDQRRSQTATAGCHDTHGNSTKRAYRELAPIVGVKEPRDLLAQRGMTHAVLASVDPWVEALANFAGADAAAAEDAPWGWYLEWSGIARAAIESRAMWRELGFGKSRRAAPTPKQPNGEPSPTPTQPTASKNPKAA